MNRFQPTVVVTLTGDIDDKPAAEFCRQMTAARDRDVEIRIDSPGGYVAPMTRMCDAIRRHPGKVTTVCTGLAASAAATIFLLGKERRVCPDSVLMVHDANSRIGQTPSTIRTSELLADILAVATSIDRQQIRAWMEATTYIDAGHCLRLKLAHRLAPLSLQTSKPSKPAPPKTASSAELSRRWNRSYEQMAENRRRRQARSSGPTRFGFSSAVPVSRKKQTRPPIVVPPPPKFVSGVSQGAIVEAQRIGRANIQHYRASMGLPPLRFWDHE